MNLRKGFLRLTLVLSISIGIVSAFVMMEREPYTKYKVTRTGEGVKELTVTLLWYEERNPDIFDFVQAFNEADKTDKRVIRGTDPWDKYKVPKDSPSDTIEEIKKNRLRRELELEKQNPRGNFSIIETTEKPVKWERFFSVMGICIALVWGVYAAIRWVVIGFIVGGFKHKT